MTAAVGTLLVILALGAVALGVGLLARWRRRSSTGQAGPGDEAFAAPPGAVPEPRLPADLTARDGRLVLLQISAAFCTHCRDTRSVLGDVAAELPGLVHRDVDLAARPELVRLLGVARTPTTLLVDPGGRELLRVDGVPRRAALVDAIGPHLESRPGHG